MKGFFFTTCSDLYRQIFKEYLSVQYLQIQRHLLDEERQ
jgi:hypothetical protein